MASVPSQRTWTSGETVTAAMLNDDLRDAINFLINNRPRAILRQTVAQSIGNGAFTSITFDTEDLDNDAGHSTVSNTSRYTAVTAGYYWVAATFCQGFNNTGARAARLATNGSALVGSQVSVQAATTSVATSICVSRMVYLNVADYLELQGFQSSGGALNTSVATEAQSQMSLFWLGV